VFHTNLVVLRKVLHAEDETIDYLEMHRNKKKYSLRNNSRMPGSNRHLSFTVILCIQAYLDRCYFWALFQLPPAIIIEGSK
jgi:hypothetical protein